MSHRSMNILLAAAASVLIAPSSGRAALGGSKAPASLAERVRHELAMLPYYSIFDNLAYRVDGGAVTLSGSVTRPTLKSDAKRAVERLPGVTQVVDNVAVLPLSGFDNRIRGAEYRAIFGYASLYRYALGANPSIHIIVDNGNVTLEGVVSNQGDKNIAGIRANQVPGVFSVTNRLVVSN